MNPRNYAATSRILSDLQALHWVVGAYTAFCLPRSPASPMYIISRLWRLSRKHLERVARMGSIHIHIHIHVDRPFFCT